ncbi:MAG TPA: hypothetical protein VGB83_00095 [Actinomycetota bacterium]
MITVASRAPARVSLVGGGTDLPAYFERFGGAVVSFTIDLYSRARAAPRAEDLVLVSDDAGIREVIPAGSYAKRMREPFIAEDFLAYQKAVAAYFEMERGTLSASSEIPTGAGLASSGSVCVALVLAVARFAGKDLDREAIADAACYVEMDMLQRGSGKQDQYAAAFGGLNLIEFFRDGSVDVSPLAVADGVLHALEQRIMLFGTGARRSAVGPLREQAARSAGDEDTVRALHALKELAHDLRDVLERGDVDALGPMLHDAWEAKQHLNSTLRGADLARAYARAREAGAAGGKLAGAGTSGTLMLFVPPAARDDVRAALGEEGWEEQPYRIDREGAVVEIREEVDGELATP